MEREGGWGERGVGREGADGERGVDGERRGGLGRGKEMNTQNR